MNIEILLSQLSKNFKNIYQNDSATFDYQTNRYKKLIELYSNIYNDNKELSIISTPGRTEIIGNHTDHNGGKVIAASINLDTVIAYSRAENEVKLKSDQYEEIFHIDLSNLDPIEKEKGKLIP
ncbi:MAG: galactokinase family protein [Ignavibacteriae bacterium]|nr:galactokinase family protein [Ignavibacteriota bacterium]